MTSYGIAEKTVSQSTTYDHSPALTGLRMAVGCGLEHFLYFPTM
jgi:hypothetical protein